MRIVEVNTVSNPPRFINTYRKYYYRNKTLRRNLSVLQHEVRIRSIFYEIVYIWFWATIFLGSLGLLVFNVVKTILEPSVNGGMNGVLGISVTALAAFFLSRGLKYLWAILGLVASTQGSQEREITFLKSKLSRVDYGTPDTEALKRIVDTQKDMIEALEQDKDRNHNSHWS